MSLLIIGLLGLLIFCHYVESYESAYDILERRNQRNFGDPRNHYLAASEDSRLYTNLGRNPTFTSRSYSSVTPFEHDSSYRHRGRVNYFGNGYDNLGNGNIRFKDRLHFIHEPMSYRKFERDYNPGFDPGYRHYTYYDWHHFARPRQDKVFERRNTDKIYGTVSGLEGNSEIVTADSLIASNEDNQQRKSMENFKNDQTSVVTDFSKKENFGEKSHSDKNAENKSTVRNNRFSKKGHVTKGFSTHHHKDETGNTTTFYDEFSDHGGQSNFKDFADGYGTKTTLEQFSNAEDSTFFSEKGGHNGNYGSGSLKDNRKLEKELVLNDNRYDKGENFRAENENYNRRRDFFNPDDRYSFDTFSNYNYY